MERHINFSDVEAVVKKIYEKYKDFEVEGAVDSRLQGVDPSKFGIVVKLTDGRVIRVGDTDALSPLGKSLYKVTPDYQPFRYFYFALSNISSLFGFHNISSDCLS